MKNKRLLLTLLTTMLLLTFSQNAFALSSRTPPANLNCYSNGSNWVLKWDTEPWNSVHAYRDGDNTIYSELTGNYILYVLGTVTSVQLSFARDLSGALNDSAKSSAIDIPSDCTGYVATPTPTPTSTPNHTPSPTPSAVPTSTPSGTNNPSPSPSGEPTNTDQPATETPEPTPEPITVEDLYNCVSILCSCIQQLVPVLNEINSSTNGVISAISYQILPQLEDVNTKLSEQLQLSQDIKNVLIEFKNEFQNPNNYPINSVNNYPSIQLTDNKPPMRETVFTDNTTYFSDQGDDEAPSAFPVAPEPSDSWKDLNGNTVTKQIPINPQPVQTKTPVLQRDTALQRDAPLQRQSPLPVQDTNIYDLHWKSSEYQP